MIYLAILWAVIGIVSAVWDHYRRGDGMSVADLLISAVLGLLVPISIFKWTDIVIRKGRK